MIRAQRYYAVLLRYARQRCRGRDADARRAVVVVYDAAEFDAIISPAATIYAMISRQTRRFRHAERHVLIRHFCCFSLFVFRFSLPPLLRHE